jgi:hypothetical protein
LSRKPYIPSARPKELRHDCRSKPKPGSKTRADKRKSENIIPRPPVQPKYDALTDEEYDAIPWEEIFALGVK